MKQDVLVAMAQAGISMGNMPLLLPSENCGVKSMTGRYKWIHTAAYHNILPPLKQLEAEFKARREGYSGKK